MVITLINVDKPSSGILNTLDLLNRTFWNAKQRNVAIISSFSKDVNIANILSYKNKKTEKRDQKWLYNAHRFLCHKSVQVPGYPLGG